jgi:hypothetical protein
MLKKSRRRAEKKAAALCWCWIIYILSLLSRLSSRSCWGKAEKIATLPRWVALISGWKKTVKKVETTPLMAPGKWDRIVAFIEELISSSRGARARFAFNSQLFSLSLSRSFWLPDAKERKLFCRGLARGINHALDEGWEGENIPAMPFAVTRA